MHKPFEIKNLKRIVSPITFQPKMVGEFSISLEVIRDLKCMSGLSKETLNEEFVNYFLNELYNAQKEYDDIIKTYYILLKNQDQDNTFLEKEYPIRISRDWIAPKLGITTSPCFKTFIGETKENITHKTSISIPRTDLFKILLNDHTKHEAFILDKSLFQYFFDLGMEEMIHYGLKYYYQAMLKYDSATDSYDLLIRGSK